jgi:hypothetical protein
VRRRRRHPDCVPRRGAPRLQRLDELVDLPRRSALHPELALALAAAARLHVLRTNLAPVPVRPTSTTGEAGAYRFRKRDPIDLRVSRRGGRVTLGFLHELGHLVDHQLQCDPRTGRWASDLHPALADWRAAVRLLERPAVRGRYFHSTREVWARAYAQTVVARSGDPELERFLAELQLARDPHVWPADGFAPVAEALERALERLGLTQLPLPLAA